jgi:hypothetical protein
MQKPRLRSSNRAWMPEEDRILEACYPLQSVEEVCSKLPGRSWNAIKKRAVLKKISRFYDAYRRIGAIVK